MGKLIKARRARSEEALTRKHPLAVNKEPKSNQMLLVYPRFGSLLRSFLLHLRIIKNLSLLTDIRPDRKSRQMIRFLVRNFPLLSIFFGPATSVVCVQIVMPASASSAFKFPFFCCSVYTQLALDGNRSDGSQFDRPFLLSLVIRPQPHQIVFLCCAKE